MARISRETIFDPFPAVNFIFVQSRLFFIWLPISTISTSLVIIRNARKPTVAIMANFCYYNLASFLDHYLPSCLDAQSEKLFPLLQSVMSEGQCVHVIVQDPTLVIGARHKCLGLLLRADIEGLVVDAFEAAFDHCILLLLCLEDTLVQVDVLHAHSLTIDYHIARNSLCCVVYHMLFINQAVHLRSQSNELRDAMSVVLVLEDGTRQLLVEIEERVQ